MTVELAGYRSRRSNVNYEPDSHAAQATPRHGRRSIGLTRAALVPSRVGIVRRL